MNYEIGSRVGDYEVLEVLGAGGMGRVYKVRNVISDRLEAMKVVLPDLQGDSDLADRFMREIKVQASLDHPNIAALHTALRLDNQLLMLMEYVEGVTIDAILRAGRIPIAVGPSARFLPAFATAKLKREEKVVAEVVGDLLLKNREMQQLFWLALLLQENQL